MSNEFYAVMLTISIIGSIFILAASGALAVGQWIDAFRFADGKRWKEMRWKLAEVVFHTAVAVMGGGSAVWMIIRFKWIVAGWMK